MSEYQYVHFMALDRPLDERQLKYMRTQSTRAEVTKWEFSNEYHYGDFGGNVKEMLRRGYDIHLHFANFGIRRLMLRLPHELPWDKKTFNRYLPEDGVAWHVDKQKNGGFLEIDPDSDAGTFDYLKDVENLLKKIAPMRELIISGDLRPLYVIWLVMTAVHGGDDTLEPPVPAGMGSLPDCLLALADFYEVGEDLLRAAAKTSPPMIDVIDLDSQISTWVARQTKSELAELVERFLNDDAASVHAETLALIRGEQGSVAWPTAEPTRTFKQLLDLSKKVETQRVQRKATSDAKARTKLLSSMAANPQAVIDEVELLVRKRSNANYVEAGKKLADLREALGPVEGPARVLKVATELREKYPTLHRLVAEFRRQGILRKRVPAARESGE